MVAVDQNAPLALGMLCCLTSAVDTREKTRNPPTTTKENSQRKEENWKTKLDRSLPARLPFAVFAQPCPGFSLVLSPLPVRHLSSYTLGSSFSFGETVSPFLPDTTAGSSLSPAPASSVYDMKPLTVSLASSCALRPASRKSSSHSATSLTSISLRPFTRARILEALATWHTAKRRST